MYLVNRYYRRDAPLVLLVEFRSTVYREIFPEECLVHKEEFILDHLDLSADHIVVYDDCGNIAGAVRIIYSRRSQGEFTFSDNVHIQSSTQGEVAEISRLIVRKQSRGYGIVFALLIKSCLEILLTERIKSVFVDTFIGSRYSCCRLIEKAGHYIKKYVYIDNRIPSIESTVFEYTNADIVFLSKTKWFRSIKE